MAETYHFQVNLGGMLDVLSNHLYKSPDVFLRELLQNGIDAITLRHKQSPAWTAGEISIRVTEGQSLAFSDNGAGLTEEGIHQFLAVIGQSSKTALVNGQLPEDYIGRFGIGLLSCFMVSESIVVHTCPAAGGPAHVWRGLPDGTYTLAPLAHCATGTTVLLTAKAGCEGYFTKEKIAALVRYYGLALPVPVHFAGQTERLNQIPSDFVQTNRGQLLAFGQWLFGEEFLDAIPIHTPHLNGVAFIIPYTTASTVKHGHRIYLKQMLLTERGDHLLPSWAFFLQCFLNASGLRPTASREDFYEDDALDSAQGEFADALSTYLKNLAATDPDRLRIIIQIHALALKSIAVWDDTLFHLFIDYLPFESSEGAVTGQALRQAGEISYVSTLERFKQLKPLFLAQGKLLLCAAYTHDMELLTKLHNLCDVPIAPLREEGIETVLKPLSMDQREASGYLVQIANQALCPFDCRVIAKCFLPAELPALYAMSDEVRFLREVQTAQDMSHGVLSDTMASLLADISDRPMATLYFNLNCLLIQKLCSITNANQLTSIARILYIQAMMVGGYPLHNREMQVMGHELLQLINWSSPS